METIEEQYEKATARVVERWGGMPFTYCKYGHIDCSTVRGGECLNEETAKEIERGNQ